MIVCPQQIDGPTIDHQLPGPAINIHQIADPIMDAQ